MRRSRPARTHSLVRPIDVTAVGFAVAPPGTQTRRVVIEREPGGAWKVVDDSDLRDVDEAAAHQAISVSAAIICGANLTGMLVTRLQIAHDVRWVSVSRPRRRSGRRCSVRP